MTTITSSANGTYIDCGLTQGVSLTITCGGPSCQSLQSYPNLNCVTDSSSTTSTCTNGITCAGSTNFKSAFMIIQHSDNTITSSQMLTIDGQTFSGSDNGNGDVSYSGTAGQSVSPLPPPQSISSVTPANPESPAPVPNSPVPNPNSPTPSPNTPVPNSPVTPIQSSETGESTTSMIILPPTIAPPPGNSASTVTATNVVVNTGTRTASSSGGAVPVASSHSDFRLRPSRVLLVIAMILSLFVSQIQAKSPGAKSKALLGLLPFVLSILPSGVWSQSLTPGGSCSLSGGTYCAAAFGPIILTCLNGTIAAGNCDDNLAGVPSVGITTDAICGNSSASNAACYLPPYPAFITPPVGESSIISSTTSSSITPTSTTSSSSASTTSSIPTLSECSISGFITSLSSILADTTDAGTVLIVETYTVFDVTGCPASFTAYQSILAGGKVFTAPPEVITVEAEQQVFVASYSFAGLSHTMLRTLGPIVQWTESWVPIGTFSGGGSYAITLPSVTTGSSTTTTSSSTTYSSSSSVIIGTPTSTTSSSTTYSSSSSVIIGTPTSTTSSSTTYTTSSTSTVPPSTPNPNVQVWTNINSLFPGGNAALIAQVEQALCSQAIPVINSVVSGQVSRAQGVTQLVEACQKLFDTGEPVPGSATNPLTSFQFALGNILLCDKVSNSILTGTLVAGSSSLCDALSSVG